MPEVIVLMQYAMCQSWIGGDVIELAIAGESRKMPCTYEVVFYNETEDSPGVMLWRYPEPKVLTFVRITPVPFNTTEDPDISTADLGDVIQCCIIPHHGPDLSKSRKMPCTYEVVFYNETEDSPGVMLWRYPEPKVLTFVRITPVPFNTTEDPDISTADLGDVIQALRVKNLLRDLLFVWTAPTPHHPPHPDNVVSSWDLRMDSTVLAAIMERQSQQMIEEEHKRERRDAKRQEEAATRIEAFMERLVVLELQLSAELDCKLLEYRNLTMQFSQAIHSPGTSEQLIDGNVFVDLMFVNVGQYTVHSLDTAPQAWQQNRHLESEELVFSHFVICNDTHETLRFGQVDADENVLLAGLHSHQYSWRSHKSPQGVTGFSSSVRAERSMEENQSWDGERWAGRGVRGQRESRQEVRDEKRVEVGKSTESWEKLIEGSSSVRAEQSMEENQSWDGERWAGRGVRGQRESRQEVRDEKRVEVGKSTESWEKLIEGRCERAAEKTGRGNAGFRWKVTEEVGGAGRDECDREKVIKQWSEMLRGVTERAGASSPWCLATLWALFQCTSVNDICNAAVWAVPHTFTRFYRQNVLDPQNPGFGTSVKDGFLVHPYNTRIELLHICIEGWGNWRWSEPFNVGTFIRTIQYKGGTASLIIKVQPLNGVQKQLCLNTLLIELLPWALLANQSKWYLWLFEGEKIVLQIPAGNVIIPPNFKPVNMPDSAVFSLSPAGSQTSPQPSSVPCWDLLTDTSRSDVEAPLPSKQVLLSFSPGAGADSVGGQSCWSLPAGIRQDFPRQSVAVPIQPCSESGFCTRAIVLAYEEHLGVTYMTLTEDPCPRMIINSNCPVPLVMKENIKGEGPSELYTVEVYCASLQGDSQLCNTSSFHFPVLLCQEQKADTLQWSRDSNPVVSVRDLEEYKHSSASPCLKHGTVALVSTKALGNNPVRTISCLDALVLPEQVEQSIQALVNPVKLQKLTIQPVNLLVSIHASLKLYIASDHTPLSFSLFERGLICTTARQLMHALAMHYAAEALFWAGWVVGSLKILGSPTSLMRSKGNSIADFFRLPYEGLTCGPGDCTLTLITNLATSLAKNMDHLSLDEEHYHRQEEWRRQLPESQGDGLHQGLSRLGISLLGQCSQASSPVKGISVERAADFMTQLCILHGAGLCQFPKHLYLPNKLQAAQAPKSHIKYIWKILQSRRSPEIRMAMDVTIVSGSEREHKGCLLLTSEVLFVVSLSEDKQQQAFPVTEIKCAQDTAQDNLLKVILKQQRVPCELEEADDQDAGFSSDESESDSVPVAQLSINRALSSGLLQSCRYPGLRQIHPDFLFKLLSTWGNPATATAVSRSVDSLYEEFEVDKLGLTQFPPVRAPIAALVQPTNLSLLPKDAVCPNKQCKEKKNNESEKFPLNQRRQEQHGDTADVQPDPNNIAKDIANINAALRNISDCLCSVKSIEASMAAVEGELSDIMTKCRGLKTATLRINPEVGTRHSEDPEKATQCVLLRLHTMLDIY
ncbi:UNVERIFIED_CONTAM: hypothetical protein FKN15_048780 [Acipenser sinensis]